MFTINKKAKSNALTVCLKKEAPKEAKKEAPKKKDK